MNIYTSGIIELNHPAFWCFIGVGILLVVSLLIEEGRQKVEQGAMEVENE